MVNVVARIKLFWCGQRSGNTVVNGQHCPLWTTLSCFLGNVDRFVAQRSMKGWPTFSRLAALPAYCPHGQQKHVKALRMTNIHLYSPRFWKLQQSVLLQILDDGAKSWEAAKHCRIWGKYWLKRDSLSARLHCIIDCFPRTRIRRKENATLQPFQWNLRERRIMRESHMKIQNLQLQRWAIWNLSQVFHIS